MGAVQAKGGLVMSRQEKALDVASTQGKKKSARRDGNARYLFIKPIPLFCQGFISAFNLPLSLAYHQLLNLVIDLAVRFDIRWQWSHRLADRQEIRDE